MNDMLIYRLYACMIDGDVDPSSRNKQAVMEAARKHSNKRRATATAAAGEGGGDERQERVSKKVRLSIRDSGENAQGNIASQDSAASSVASESHATRRSLRTGSRFSTTSADDDESNHRLTDMSASDMHTENDDTNDTNDAESQGGLEAPAEANSDSSGTALISHTTSANITAQPTVSTADESFTDMITRSTANMLTHSNNILAAREALLHIATLTQASCLHTELPLNLDKGSRVIVVLEQYMEYLKAVCIIY